MTADDGRTGRIAVLGIGNVLTGDDALGPYAVRVLEAEYEIPEAVVVLDVGTPGLDLTPHLSEVDAVIVVDTVVADAPPGTIRQYRLPELLAMPPLPRTSPHEPGLREALLVTELTGTAPHELLLVGVVPSSTATGTGLTAAIRGAVPQVIAAVLDELQRLGITLQRRTRPAPADIWWERTPEGSPS